jgi:hypothetical protein
MAHAMIYISNMPYLAPRRHHQLLADIVVQQEKI